MILTKNRNQIKNPIGGGGVNVFQLVSQATDLLFFGGGNVFWLVSQATGLLSFGGGNVFWLVSQATGLLSFGGGEGVKSEVNIKNVGWVKPNINYICKSYRDSLGSRPLNDCTLESFTYQLDVIARSGSDAAIHMLSLG